MHHGTLAVTSAYTRYCRVICRGVRLPGMPRPSARETKTSTQPPRLVQAPRTSQLAVVNLPLKNIIAQASRVHNDTRCWRLSQSTRTLKSFVCGASWYMPQKREPATQHAYPVHQRATTAKKESAIAGFKTKLLRRNTSVRFLISQVNGLRIRASHVRNSSPHR